MLCKHNWPLYLAIALTLFVVVRPVSAVRAGEILAQKKEAIVPKVYLVQAILVGNKAADRAPGIDLERGGDYLDVQARMRLQADDRLTLRNRQVTVVLQVPGESQHTLSIGSDGKPVVFVVPAPDEPLRQRGGVSLYRIASKLFKALVGDKESIPLGVEGTAFRVTVNSEETVLEVVEGMVRFGTPGSPAYRLVAESHSK